MSKERVGFVTMGEVARAGEVPEIGVGMLGYAFMGKAHTNAYKKMPYMMYPPPATPKLLAICGRNEEAVSEAARRYGYESYYTDWREMLKDDRIQLFDNGGPNNLHAEPCIEAVKAGKHVFCEKPLARNAEEAKKMWDAVRQAGVKHMCAFNYRFIPAIRQIKLLMDEGALGEIYHFRLRYLQEWIAEPDFAMGWRLKKEICGSGALGDLGSHVFDLARFLVGEPKRVSGILKTFITERPSAEDPNKKEKVDVDDAFEAVVEFENGAVGTLEASRFCHGRRNHQALEINGSKGSIAFNLERLNELEVYWKGGRKETMGFTDVLVTEIHHPFWEHWWPHGHIIGWEHSFVHEVHHLLDAIANDKDIAPYGATFEDGYKCAVIGDAVAQSSETGERVEIRY